MTHGHEVLEMMKYNNSNVRRQDRLLNEQRAIELLETAEYGTLSMIDEDGLPYGIPVNFVWDGKDSLYIHCAPEGRKLRAIAAHPEISFSIVGNVNLQPSKFTTEYESIVLKGKARVGLSTEERMQALVLLVEKLSPNDVEIGKKYIEKSFHRTEIIRMDMTEFSGKTKKMA